MAAARVWNSLNKPTNKQTNKQARQASKQTDKQTNKQTNVDDHVGKDLAATSFVFVVGGANRSSYGLLGTDTVNIFPSVNYITLTTALGEYF